MHNTVDNSKTVAILEAHGVNQDAWEEFTEYRKAKRKPVSAFAQKKLWVKLQRHTPEVQQEMVDRSIENDWQGLFEPPAPQRGSLPRPGAKQLTRDRSIEQDLLDTSWAE